LTPSINALYKTQINEWAHLNLDETEKFPLITIIDRQDEFKKGNYSALSEKLQQCIKINLDRGQKTFLFLNRKGSATLVSCKDCGYTATCPTCHLPLTYYKKSGVLLCHHCNYKTDLFLFCPKCKSPELKLAGMGTEKADLEIKNMFPQKKIAMIDLDNKNQDKLNDADIIIGTQYAINYIDWTKIQTIGVINADTLFYIADYRSFEKTFNLLFKLIRQLQDINNEFICQTSSPDNLIFSALKQTNPELFYQQELAERKDLAYPPFGKLIKLIYQNIEFNSGEAEINEIYTNIKTQLSRITKDITINPPQLAATQQVRGRFRWLIIFKIINEEIKLDFLNSLPDSVIIDIDPESLL